MKEIEKELKKYGLKPLFQRSENDKYFIKIGDVIAYYNKGFYYYSGERYRIKGFIKYLLKKNNMDLELTLMEVTE